MKKIFNLLFIVTILSISITKAQAMTFDQGFSQINQKPLAVLIYAQWADGYQDSLTNFSKSQQKLGNIYNFVELDIASKDTKAFNQRYSIQPKLPYVSVFTNMGKITRYIDAACTADSDCLNTKLKSFIK